MLAAARAFQPAYRVRLITPARISPALGHVASAERQGYATQSSLGGSTNSSTNIPRKAVTVTSDDGRHTWAELTTREKVARSTQQTVNLALVTAGAIGTVRNYMLLLCWRSC